MFKCTYHTFTIRCYYVGYTEMQCHYVIFQVHVVLLEQRLQEVLFILICQMFL